MIETQIRPIGDPKEPSFTKSPFLGLSAEMNLEYGFPPLSPARQWLYDHKKNFGKKPYVSFTEEDVPVVRKGLEITYPGLENKIRKARDAGYTETQIMSNITILVDKALEAGYTDEAIEENLYSRNRKFGILEQPTAIALRRQVPHVAGKMSDYLSVNAREDWLRYANGNYTDWEIPIDMWKKAAPTETELYYEEKFNKFIKEISAVASRAFAGISANLSNLLPHTERPTTVAGTIAGEIAYLVGYIAGPLKAAKWITGSRLAPTATGLKGVAQMMKQGGATLGLASGMSSVVPAIQNNENLTQMGIDVLKQASGSAIVGALYPLSGAIESKPLRLAVGLAVLDKLRAGHKEWFTIDNVISGIKDGTIDRDELAERTFGYLLDIYFISKVPSMKQQLATLHKNALIKEIMQVNSDEAEHMIISLAKEGLIPGIDPKYFHGLTDTRIKRMFGSEKNFETAFRAMKTNQIELAADLIKEGKISPRPASTRARTLKDAIKTEIMFNRADAELKTMADGKFKRLRHQVARTVWDTSANIKAALLKDGGDLGKEAIIRHDLINGASTKAHKILRDVADKIYKGLTKEEHIQLNRIIQSRRTIAIDKYKKGIKHPGGLGGKAHQAYLDSLPKEMSAKLNAKADIYFAEMHNQLSQLLNAGLLTEASYEALKKAGDYSPRKYIQHIDPDITYTSIGGKKITVPNSGIKRLSEGSYRTLENNSQLLLGEVIGRTQSRLFRNEANKALWALAEQLPDNGVVTKAKIIRTTKTGKPVYQKTPTGFEKVKVVIKGQTKELLMPQQFAAEWVGANPAVEQQWMNIMGWIFGAKVLRPMATGLNPEFAITNLPRDIAHAWMVSEEWSPHMPVAVAQIAKDFASVAKDTFSRQGRWLNYIDEGGGMSFLTHQGRLTKQKVAGKYGLQDVLGYLGETSEIWTRLALRERALRNGKQPHQATWEARNYLDFSQGGSFIKSTDSFVPYLNAGVQGTRGIFHSAKTNPKVFSYKMAQVGTLATGLYLANRTVNPECYDAISDYDKTNYFCITTPITWTDEDGQERHLYFRVAKDQGQKFICSAFENSMAKVLGEEVDADQLSMAAQEFISIAPVSSIPPTVDAALGYYCNKDFWRRKDIWTGPDILPQEEYRSYTHPAFVKFGQITKMSPEKTAFALEQYFTRNNIYTSAVGLGLRQIMDELPIDVKQETTSEMLRQAPFLRRVLKTTDPYSEHRKELKEIKIEDATRKFVANRELDALSEQFYSKQITKQEVIQFINSQPWQDRSSLIDRHSRYGKYYNIPDKVWWLNVSYLSPEAKATVYWTRHKQSTAAQQKKLENTLKKLPGIKTARFIARLNELKKIE